MPSKLARLASAKFRIFSATFFRHYYPVWYSRFGLSKISPKLDLTPKGVQYESLTAGGLPAAWLIPEGAENDRVLLYLHGGWFVVGSIESHRKMVARIAAAAGCRALVVDYRLAPEHPFPAALEDSLSAYKWLLAEGYRPDRTVIAGDSAGGGLTASTLVSLRDAGDPMPAAAVMLSPMTDLLLSGDSVKTKAKEDPFVNEQWCRKCIGMYLGSTDPKEPLASPLYADLKGLPPILIQVGSREILLDDSVRFADHARQDGVSVELDVWDGMFHVWQINGPQMPESMDAIRKLGDYCRDKMAAGGQR